MKALDFNKCSVDNYIPLDKDGCFDDSQTGQYGFRVFYNVPRDEVIKSELFEVLDDDLIGGQLEFTVDGNGDLTGEVLLWTTVADIMKKDKKFFENKDFENYDGDITPFVNDFFDRLNRW